MFPILLLIATPEVQLATREDCEVMLAAASGGDINWGAATPPRDFYPELTTTPGNIWRYDCDWAALGVGAPTIGTPASKTGFAFTAPVYAADRLSATVESTIFVAPHFLQASRCRVKKMAGRWKFDGCQVTLIT